MNTICSGWLISCKWPAENVHNPCLSCCEVLAPGASSILMGFLRMRLEAAAVDPDGWPDLAVMGGLLQRQHGQRSYPSLNIEAHLRGRLPSPILFVGQYSGLQA